MRVSHLLALLLSLPPPVSPHDLSRFPPAAVAVSHRAAAARNLHRLKLLRSIDTREQVALAVDEAQYTLACWIALDNAHRSREASPDDCLDSLAALRHLLREGAWRAGAMPPLQ